MMTGHVHALYRFPVKGLSAEPLELLELETGRPIAHDRQFAIMHGGTHRQDSGRSQWRPKGNFLQLMSNERLANLETRFDAASGNLTILRHGRPVSRGRITDLTGRAILEQFFSGYMRAELRGRPRIVESGDEPFADSRAPYISIINLESVRDLERVVGQPVDPMRFRANVLIDGVPAWQELAWRGRSLRLGSAELCVEDRIGRCAATNVNPSTGLRDLTLPLSMRRAYGHEDCGAYAIVTAQGAAGIGDAVTVIE